MTFLFPLSLDVLVQTLKGQLQSFDMGFNQKVMNN